MVKIRFVFETERSTIYPKDPIARVFFSFCLGQMVEIRECTPDDSLLASVKLHAIAPRHIRVSPFPNSNRCKATPL